MNNIPLVFVNIVDMFVVILMVIDVFVAIVVFFFFIFVIVVAIDFFAVGSVLPFCTIASVVLEAFVSISQVVIGGLVIVVLTSG